MSLTPDTEPRLARLVTEIMAEMDEPGWDETASQYLLDAIAEKRGRSGVIRPGASQVPLATCHVDPDQVCWSAVIRDSRNKSQQPEAE